MNFDGGRVKTVCVASLQVSFIGYVGRTFFKGGDMRLSLAFFQSKTCLFSGNIFEFKFNSPWSALNSVYRQKFKGKCYKYNIFDIILYVFLCGSVVWVDYLTCKGSGFNLQQFSFFYCCCLFVLFAFLSLGMFSFYSTAGPLFELHEVLWYTLWVIRYDQMSLGMASNYP